MHLVARWRIFEELKSVPGDTRNSGEFGKNALPGKGEYLPQTISPKADCLFGERE
jgi:hypothetical protein